MISNSVCVAEEIMMQIHEYTSWKSLHKCIHTSLEAKKKATSVRIVLVFSFSSESTCSDSQTLLEI